MLSTLIRKDLRVYRPVLIGAAIATALPYVIWFVAHLINPIHYSDGDEGEIAGGWGMALAGLVATAFGGMAFASERRERSAEFLAMLPVPRGRVVRSKLLVSLACLAVMVCLHAVALFARARWQSVLGNPQAWPDFRHNLMAATAILLAFGTAWVVSSVIESAVISACAGIGVTFVSTIVVATWLRDVGHGLWGAYREPFVFAGYAAFAVLFGTAFIVTVRAIYLRRVAP